MSACTSHGIKANGFLFVSGQLGLDPKVSCCVFFPLLFFLLLFLLSDHLFARSLAGWLAGWLTDWLDRLANSLLTMSKVRRSR